MASHLGGRHSLRPRPSLDFSRSPVYMSSASIDVIGRSSRRPFCEVGLVSV